MIFKKLWNLLVLIGESRYNNLKRNPEINKMY